MSKVNKRQYYTSEQMDQKYFTDTSVEKFYTPGALNAVGLDGIQFIIDNAYSYGLSKEGRRSYFLKFAFEVVANDCMKVTISDANAEIWKTLTVAGLKEKYNGNVYIKEDWNGAVTPKIVDEHYITVYLPHED